MSEEKYTRCPNCRTAFRVTPSQLEARDGQVRCGQCQTVFDGVAHLVQLTPRREFDDDDDDAVLGPPTFAPRGEQAVEVPPLPEPETLAGVSPPAAPALAEPVADDAPWEVARPQHRYAGLAWGIGAALLILVLGGQLLFLSRESIAARWPATIPMLAHACAPMGCTVGAPREIGDLAIQASDLQADPAHQGLLILTATVRNRSAVAVSYPYLELALTDAQDQVVVRRALAPADYAGGTADLARGIPGNGEVAIKLFIDASATSQAGYRLYLFYV